MGGPAAGKSTLKRELKIKAPVCEINPDDYKLLLYSEGSKNASLVHEESSFIVDQIMKALKAMPKRPDVLLDVVKSSEDKMDILAKGGATLHLTIATCEAETAINRAYDRATKSENPEDRGRFVPTKEILLGHKKESLILPGVIGKYRINLDLFDTSNPEEPILIAELEIKRTELKIHHLSHFLKFIRKALINEYATNKDQVFLHPFDGKAMYKELMKYIDEGVTLSFFKEGTLYCKIDPSTGLTGLDDWFDLLSDEISRGGFNYTVLGDLLLYFAYPHYCNGLLIEIPGKPINLMNIKLSNITLIRNKESKMQIHANDSLRNIFPKLCESYPTIKLLKPTPLKEKEFPELIEMIRGKELRAEETNQSLSSAFFALEAKNYKDLDRFLSEMLSQQQFDYVNRIVARAILSYPIFPVANLLPDSGSIWVSDTIKDIVKFQEWYEITNVHFNRSLKLGNDPDADKDRVALVGCPEQKTNPSFYWR